jgi:hypothetical protein
MEVKLAAPPGAVIELKGLSGSVQASCKPFPLKGAIGADTSLDGLRVCEQHCIAALAIFFSCVY